MCKSFDIKMKRITFILTITNLNFWKFWSVWKKTFSQCLTNTPGNLCVFEFQTIAVTTFVNKPLLIYHFC